MSGARENPFEYATNRLRLPRSCMLWKRLQPGVAEIGLSEWELYIWLDEPPYAVC